MRNKGWTHTPKKPRFGKAETGRSADDLIREARQKATSGYREQSLRIHGLICAKCAREFDQSDRHLLTVHHKDGNPNNNPPDGSNWENLCVYCHEDEHSRSVLGDYFNERR
ncbi:MAG: putative cytosolic protein [Deltaproteobacteria bacterium]|jgi:hypothetical protein|nr:putative cytosolic protein [Deltaproteobacteria bacterium]